MAAITRGAILLASTALSGCVMLPVDGPAPRDITSSAVVHAAADRRAVALEYAVVDLNALVLETLADVRLGSIYSTFGLGSGSTPVQRVGIGDVIQVSIFEATAAGAFQSVEGAGGVRADPFVAIPAQTVTSPGYVSVPYAGTIRVAGRMTSEIQKDIEAKLASRAIEPQVIVSVLEYNSSAVTVVGDGVAGGNRVRLTGAGDHILDVISRAGGTRYPGYELFVTLHRSGRQKTIHFPRLVEDPRENIRAMPADTIYVFRRPQKFVAVGAIGTAGQTSGLTGQFSFEQDHLSLNEALAKAGGLQDARADPAQVFIYREEQRETLERMGVNVSKISPEKQWISTVYRANFRDPSSFIFANRFDMRHKDVIYAANSDSTEIVKFLAFARTITSTVAGVAVDTLVTRDAIRALGN